MSDDFVQDGHKPMRAISCVFAALLMLIAFSSPVLAQSEPEDDLYSVVDRAYALVEQLQTDLDSDASQPTAPCVCCLQRMQRETVAAKMGSLALGL